MKCVHCGVEIADDANFCNKCGYSFNQNPKKKRNIVLYCVILAIVIACGIGVFSYERNQQIQRELLEAEQHRQELIDSFENKAGELYITIEKASSNFSIIGNMFGMSTKMNTGLLGPSFFTDYVEGLCASEIIEEKNRKVEIDKINEEILELECDEEEIQDIKQCCVNLYSSYTNRYNLLIGMDFDIANFSMFNTESIKDHTEKLKDIKDVIDELEIDINEETIEDEGEEKDL